MAESPPIRNCFAISEGETSSFLQSKNGEGEIRTLGTISSTHAFQAGLLNRSSTSPISHSDYRRNLFHCSGSDGSPLARMLSKGNHVSLRRSSHPAKCGTCLTEPFRIGKYLFYHIPTIVGTYFIVLARMGVLSPECSSLTK